MSVGVPLDSKHTEDSFSPTLTDSLQLRIDQVPRYCDLVILVVTTDRQTDCFTPVHARGVTNVHMID